MQLFLNLELETWNLKLSDVSFGPLIQHVETPRSGPGRLSIEVTLPNGGRVFRADDFPQLRRQVSKSVLNLRFQRSTQPRLPGKSKSPLRLVDYLCWQEILERCHQQSLRCPFRKLHLLRQMRHKLYQRMIKKWHTHFQPVGHAH